MLLYKYIYHIIDLKVSNHGNETHLVRAKDWFISSKGIGVETLICQILSDQFVLIILPSKE